MNQTATRWALVAPILLTALPSQAHSAPTGPQDLFVALSIEDALARADNQDRLLLAFFDNAESVDAKRMLAQTFTDQGVSNWITDHAIAVKVSSEDRDTLNKYGVNLLPTTMLLTGERKVLLKAEGFRSPVELLVAVNTATLGLDDPKRPEGVQSENPMAWMAWGNHLFNNDPSRADEALESYLWALENGESHLPGFRAMHLEFLLERIAYLKPFTDKAVQSLLRGQRDLKGKIVRGEATDVQVHEFVRYSFWVRKENATVDLFVELKDSEDPRIIDLRRQLMRADLKRVTAWRHYEDVLMLVPEPMKEIQSRVEAYTKAFEEGAEGADADVRSQIVDDASDYFECLLAIGRGGDGMALASIVTSAFPTGRVYRSFIERTTRLDLFNLAERLGKEGLEKVKGKGRRLIELELQRAAEKAKGKKRFNDFFENEEEAGEDDGDGER